MEFEWDPVKNEENLRKHGIDFFEAQRAFLDPNRVITLDVTHSSDSE
ncbi:BrnT family toxin, partial [Leptospira sp. B5-022]